MLVVHDVEAPGAHAVSFQARALTTACSQCMQPAHTPLAACAAKGAGELAARTHQPVPQEPQWFCLRRLTAGRSSPWLHTPAQSLQPPPPEAGRCCHSAHVAVVVVVVVTVGVVVGVVTAVMDVCVVVGVEVT